MDRLILSFAMTWLTRQSVVLPSTRSITTTTWWVAGVFFTITLLPSSIQRLIVISTFRNALAGWKENTITGVLRIRPSPLWSAFPSTATSEVTGYKPKKKFTVLTLAVCKFNSSTFIRVYFNRSLTNSQPHCIKVQYAVGLILSGDSSKLPWPITPTIIINCSKVLCFSVNSKVL